MTDELSVSEKIREAITAAKPELLKISPELAAKKSKPGSWSKKEILGHLIDSASNNHQRFVRGAQNAAMDFPVYKQDPWVEVQHYIEMEWSNLIELFYQYNYHISRVIDFLPPDSLNNLCNMGKENPATIKFVIEDYLRHLKHHLKKILE
ncbi:MAG: DinB family protein [Ignavibacteriaceae bacterium]